MAKLLLDKMTDEIHLIYSLYKPITKPDCIKPIADIFRKHIVDQGNNLVASIKAQNEMTEKEISIKDILDKSSYMDNLLEMLSFYKEMVIKCFDSDTKFKSMI